jgi:hypothetical protein
MKKGFLTIAQNGKYDYEKMAYLLAMSIKHSQKKIRNISVIINEDSKISDKQKSLFDEVIYVNVPKEEWKVQNKWKYFDLTPYDETIVLDCDMLFFNDINEWWNILSNFDINFTTRVRNYRNEIIQSDYYRKTFTKNNLPTLYTALFYFKKSKKIEDFFHFLRIIFENWTEFYSKLLKDPPNFFSGDVAYSLAAKAFFNRNWYNISNFLTFVHMRGRLQDEDIFGAWTKELPVFFTKYKEKIELKINNFNQFCPFHYIEKNFVNEEIIELYEETLRIL